MAKRNTIDRILSPIREFISDSRAIGIVLICCTIISLIVSNSNWAQVYLDFWHKPLNMPADNVHLPDTPLHFINDALMAIFFLLAGMEIKRELWIGELSSFRKAMLPVFAAVGGMVIPACIYLFWCRNTYFSHGWGIPMATDIAFSLGILSLLGKRAPLSLRIFLTALAIIDDLGGILTIAIFYANGISWMYLFMGSGMFFVLLMMNLFKVRGYYLYFLFGLLMWYFIFNSGVHATVAGVLLAFALPLYKINEVEHAIHDPVHFIILPLFALANTAITFPAQLSDVFTSIIHHAVLTGLVIGKPLGISLFTLLAIKLGIGELPKGLRMKHIIGMGMIAGIGFTISIFMTTLAFDNMPEVQTIAKMGIISASVISGIAGYTFLSLINIKKKRPAIKPGV